MEMERKYSLLTAEYDNLKEGFRFKCADLEEWKKKHHELEVSRFQEIEELRNQFESYKRSGLVKIYKIRPINA